MKTIIVDDELWTLTELEDACNAMKQVDLKQTFNNPFEALAYAKKNVVDLAFLDVEMPGMKGTDLARRLKELYPKMLIIFVTAYDKYLMESMEIQADYYVLKPFTQEGIEAVLERAVLISRRLEKKVQVHTFGAFDIIIDGQAIPFSSQKAKELMALIVDARGDVLEPEVAFKKLWPDSGKVYNNYTGAAYRKTVSRLQKVLEDYGCSDLLVLCGGARALNCEACDCDLIDYTKHKGSKGDYKGDYMTQYEWAKATKAQLEKLKSGAA